MWHPSDAWRYRSQNSKPQFTEFVSESRFWTSMMSKLTKSFIGPVNQRSCSGYRQRTRNNKFSMRTEILKAAEILENSSMDQWRHVKDVENTADIWTRGMSFEAPRESVWLSGLAWLKNYEDDWQKPWCQENEVEAEQAIRTLATEIQVEQTFDWNRYSSFNKIRNFIAFCMTFKTKEKGPSKQTRSIKQNKNCFKKLEDKTAPWAVK